MHKYPLSYQIYLLFFSYKGRYNRLLICYTSSSGSMSHMLLLRVIYDMMHLTQPRTHHDPLRKRVALLNKLQQRYKNMYYLHTYTCDEFGKSDSPLRTLTY